MSEQKAFYPDRFNNAARYYTTGRSSYPALLSRRVADLIGLDRNADVLDLGTGPGFLAIDLAPYARAVTALDPSAEMLRVAAENAARAGVVIQFVRGSSYDLDRRLGHFRLATFGRSFHWTDRVETLRVLDGLIESGGAVALYHTSVPTVPQNVWYPVFERILDRYGNDDPARAERKSAASDETVLLDSAFDHLERIAVIEQRITPLEHFVDRALSFGKAWHGGIQAQQELAAEIRAELARYAREDGAIEEIVEGHALIARRSREVSGRSDSSA
ncbi:class I SAM-dependent methyltransferase [Caballeronia sp. LjRoot31]|uniref:class I SAM-dependent methyltransferase n=1 Tax=Caballeronia sp. LjRoot31 TaxID=3342324 RepID=UPI003ECEB605